MSIASVKGLVCQLKDLMTDGKIGKEDAISIIGNVVDLDKVEPDTEVESYVYHWIDELLNKVSLQKYF